VDEDPAGVTLHFMDEDLDTGEIIAKERVEKKFSDTGKDLHERLEDAQVELFKEKWPDIVDNSIDTKVQERYEGTYHKSAEFDELCEIDLDKEYRAEELLNILRALTSPPYKNAYVEKNGEKYYIEIDIEKAEE
jgi:methionyl-tRNA formyltransferase